MKLVRLLAFVLFTLVALGCGSRRQSFLASPIAQEPVRIVVGRAYGNGDRLFVEAQVTNTGDKPMTLDRNGVMLKLEDGQVIGRSIGITSTKHPYQIEPGRTRPVHVDFRAEDFKWRDVKKARIDWGNAISIEGKQVSLEPMSLTARASEEGDWN